RPPALVWRYQCPPHSESPAPASLTSPRVLVCSSALSWGSRTRPLARGSLVHRRSSFQQERRRSSSAIDRTDTRGRCGRLFWSVVTADRGPGDRHPPHRKALNASVTIYEGVVPSRRDAD